MEGRLSIALLRNFFIVLLVALFVGTFAMEDNDDEIPTLFIKKDGQRYDIKTVKCFFCLFLKICTKSGSSGYAPPSVFTPLHTTPPYTIITSQGIVCFFQGWAYDRSYDRSHCHMRTYVKNNVTFQNQVKINQKIYQKFIKTI
jgi:hypothetical protein